jgi:arylsulfatase A-like enzyme
MGLRPAILTAMLLVAGSTPAFGAEARPSNLVLISIDTLRADRLGCYGHDRPTSPTIDALAGRGVLFADASAPSPWTKPSHASLFTGLYPGRNGVTTMDGVLSAEATHLAERLAEQGFETLAVVNSRLLAESGLERGFSRLEHVPYRQGNRRGSPVTATAIEVLEHRDRGRPLFAFVHYMDVHSDYASLPAYEQRFTGKYDGYADGSTQQLYRYSLGLFRMDDDDAAHLLDLYDAGIRQVDDRLGRLFAYLERDGLLEDTLIVLVSDHGEEFLEHGGVLHGHSQFQEVVRVPWIMAGPSVADGRSIGLPVSLIDVAPTVLDLLGIPAAEGLDGVSLGRLVRGGTPSLERRTLFYEADVVWPPPGPGISPMGSRRAARRGRYKLHYDVESLNAGLFDLDEDPGETVNVIADHSDLARELWIELRRHLALSPEASKGGTD